MIDVSRDKFLIIASDGLWEKLGTQKVTKYLGIKTQILKDCSLFRVILMRSHNMLLFRRKPVTLLTLRFPVGGAVYRSIHAGNSNRRFAPCPRQHYLGIVAIVTCQTENW